MQLEFKQDVDKTIALLREAATWLLKSGKEPSKWWQLDNLNKTFLFQYARPEDFYVGLVNDEPAVAAILQTAQEAQDWKSVDGDQPQPALYIHWLCVSRQFAGQGLTASMIDFATGLAGEKGLSLLRVDTNANEQKLRKIYTELDFKLMNTMKDDYRETVLYQKSVNHS